MVQSRPAAERNLLSNSRIAELLAISAETAKMPQQKALRRASRKPFLWPEEATSLLIAKRSPTELPGVGLNADWQRVFDVAVELGKAVEIDAPDRQDLSIELLRLAKRSGCLISFGTDSHDPSQLRFMVFAIAAAVKAGIRRDRILNFMSRDPLLKWVASVRAH